MSKDLQGCAVCGTPAMPGARMSNVIVEGRALKLCRTHAAIVVAAMPKTFEDLRALFVEVSIGFNAGPSQSQPADRRSPIRRRTDDDRRVFPPRPEGRRRSAGRRADDPFS